MKNLFLPLFLLAFFCSSGQYYYKDIVGTRETNDMMKRYLSNKVRLVSLASFDNDGSKTAGFYVQQSVENNPVSLRTVTRAGDDDEGSVMTSYFDQDTRLIKTVDSSGLLVNYTTYEYDAKGNLSRVKNWSVDSTNTTLVMEEHVWSYDDSGNPKKMMRNKNLVLMDEAVFVFEDGKLVEEKTMKNGKEIATLYYYYNDRKQMTDIVRFNDRAGRLLPDYMFEYGDNGQVIQKVTVPANSSDYLIWRYKYDAKGIRSNEALYDKYRQLLARIDYTYSYW